MELLTGSLTHRFFGIPKVDPPKRALRLSICRFRVPFFDHQKVTFSEKVENPLLVMTCKSVYFTLQEMPSKSHKLTTFCCVTCRDGWSTWIGLGNEGVLRAPAVHGVSF